MVKEEDIEAYLLDNIGKSLACYSLRIAAKSKNKAAASPKKYEKQLERLNHVYIMGNISKEEYQKQSSKLKAKLADLKAENRQPSSIPKDVIQLLSDQNFPLLYNKLSRAEKKSLWRSSIDKITVDGKMPSAIHFIE